MAAPALSFAVAKECGCAPQLSPTADAGSSQPRGGAAESSAA